MNYELNIRKAAKTDAPLIAKVVAMAIGEESAILYGGENYMNVFEEIALLEDSQYSYRNAFVAEINGNAVGAVVAYDGAELYPLRKTTLEIIYKHTAKELQIADETDASEFYLDSLADTIDYFGQREFYSDSDIGTFSHSLSRSSATETAVKSTETAKSSTEDISETTENIFH